MDVGQLWDSSRALTEPLGRGLNQGATTISMEIRDSVSLSPILSGIQG